MDSLRKKKRGYEVVKMFAAGVSAGLWVLAGGIGVSSAGMYNFLIVGVLAVTAMIMSTIAAEKEGRMSERAEWVAELERVVSDE